MSDRYFSPPGRCIYCGSTESLSAEHIIPFALAGNLILLDASCPPCSRITAQFEQTCCRLIMGPTRIRMQLPTRRRRQRPDHLPFHIMRDDGTFEIVSEPITDHPTELFLFAFSKARILQGLPEFDTDEILSQAWRYGPSGSAMVDVAKKHRGKGISVGRFDVLAFCRLLAKIGHSLAVAKYGLHSFRPLAVEFILRAKGDMGYLIGGTLEQQPVVPHLHAYRCGGVTVGSRRYVVAEIRLFANLGAPLYHAVVGEIR